MLFALHLETTEERKKVKFDCFLVQYALEVTSHVMVGK